MPASANGLLAEATAPAGPDAGAAFAQWLQASGLPEALWDTLLCKISDGTIGAANALHVRSAPTVQIRVRDCSICTHRPAGIYFCNDLKAQEAPCSSRL
jgi:hypothetical protein